MKISKSQLRDITLQRSLDDYHALLNGLNADGVVEVVGDDELNADGVSADNDADETGEADGQPEPTDGGQDDGGDAGTPAEPAVDGTDVAAQSQQ